MGHTFGTDEHYLTRDVEKHRKVYAEAYPSIRIFQPETELTPKQVEKLKQKLAEEIEAKIRAEYEGKFREIIREEMQKLVETDSQTTHLVEDFIHTHYNVKPERVSYTITISENNNAKIISVLGYWRNAKYVKLEQPATITTQ